MEEEEVDDGISVVLLSPSLDVALDDIDDTRVCRECTAAPPLPAGAVIVIFTPLLLSPSTSLDSVSSAI